MLPSVQGVQGVCRECRVCAGGVQGVQGVQGVRVQVVQAGVRGGWGLSVEEQSFGKDEASKSKVWV